MSEAEVIDGEGREIEKAEHKASEVARIEAAPPLAVTPAVEASELVARMTVIEEAMKTAMVENTDYGVIPGTNKPALMKPGAEKLGVLFQLDIQLENEKVWDGDHLTVMSRAVVYHAPSGSRLGFGEGLCSTREKKYAKRKADRLCPNCGKPTVLESRDKETKKPDGSLFCWKKKGGCGANFAAGSEQAKVLLAVKPGEVDNPDLPDTWNTVVKMAEKRARVDAVLAVTGASALFTQDAPGEDEYRASAPEPDPEPQVPAVDQARAVELWEQASAAGINLAILTSWLRDNGFPECPPLETQSEALEALQRLNAPQARKYEADVATFKAAADAQRRESSQAHAAEAEGAVG